MEPILRWQIIVFHPLSMNTILRSKSSRTVGKGKFEYPTACFLKLFKQSRYIALGLSRLLSDFSTLPGWRENWGYHGDDGRKHGGTGWGIDYADPFTKGCIVGCGINFLDHSIYFTRNGKFLGK